MIKALINNIIDKPIVLLPLYCILSLVVYFNTNGAGMVFDFNGWALLYDQGSYKDIWTCFGYPGLHQMEHLFFYSFYKIFHFNTTAWYILFALLHALCAYVGFLFLDTWLKSCRIENHFKIAGISTLFFLLSPMAADTVGNKVTIHYFLACIAIFYALHLLARYFHDRKWTQISSVFILFIFSLFCLELSYIFPAILLVVWTSIHFFQEKKIFSLKNIAITICPFILLGLFLLLHKIVIGDVVGHYGADVHLKVDIPEMFSNTIRYFASYIVFFDYWTVKYKQFAHTILKDYYLFLIPLTIFLFSAFSYIAWKKRNSKWQISPFLFILSILGLVPILNLYFYDLFAITNDRYSYLASLFIYALIITILSLFRWKKIHRVLLILFLTVNVFFLKKNIKTLSNSAKLSWSLLNDFRWIGEDVILLNVPTSFDGAMLFGSRSDTSSFAESLFLHTNIDRRAHIDVVYEMNHTTLSDGVSVQEIAPHHYRVEMNQWGCWFWNDRQGALSYENEELIVTKNSDTSYDLQLKSTAKNKTLVYSDGLKWYEFEKQD